MGMGGVVVGEWGAGLCTEDKHHRTSSATTACAACVSGRRHHEAGNVGVEHTPPGAILRALQRMRPGDAQRAAFSKGQLVELGLVAPSHDAPSVSSPLGFVTVH